jgi:hypothetical protein
MFAHVAGVPVEEMLPLVYGLTGAGVFAHLRAQRRRVSRGQRPPAAPKDRVPRRGRPGGE